VGSVFGPVRFLLPVCRLIVGFYTHWTYMHIFRHIFLSNYWWHKSDIWSQASLWSVSHIVGSVFGPIRFLLPVCRLCWFLYTLNIYAHFSSHFSQQILMAEIWYFVTSFIYVPHFVGSVFWPVRFLLPVCRLSWLLYTFNIYAHFSSHFSQQIFMTGIWYLVTSFI
jgi:hypothetical protein